ncbi:MAG: stage III sporulation AC/AD family protein [Oscillospiraceae bacterium]|nr:stage III sporulation AC/AD family protein [Oscillospiraceae bacterium]
MSMYTAAGAAVIGCLLCLVLREYHRPQAVLLSVGVCLLLLLGMSGDLQHIIVTASGLYAESRLDPGCFTVLCKAIGITWLTQIGNDICKDCGEQAIATAVTLCGRILLTALSLPLFGTLADLVLEVIG